MKAPEEQAAALIAQAMALLSQPDIPDQCVRVRRAAAVLGLSEKAIRRRIEDGYWCEGKEYHRKRAKPGSRAQIWVDLPAVAAWVRRNG